MINVITCKDYNEVSDKAAEIMLHIVKRFPNCVLGLATGSSPIGLYQRMIEDHQKNGTSYAGVTTFNLDEYVGLPITHPESYYAFMHRNLFDHIDIKEENIHIPSSQGGDLQANCDAYNAAMANYKVDIQLLGIGADGHIGFNEPNTPFDSVTHITDLVEQTIKDNARFFDNDMSKVPTQAITMGISNVMSAKQILLVATGKNKAKAIYDTVCGPVIESVPASILQQHKDVTIIVDEEAASLLPKKELVEIVKSEESFNEIVKTGSVIVDFYADWCGPCKMIAPMLHDLAEVYNGKVTIVKVNVDSNPEISTKFNVQSIPTIIAMKDGQVLNSVSGFQMKDNLIKLIESTL